MSFFFTFGSVPVSDARCLIASVSCPSANVAIKEGVCFRTDGAPIRSQLTLKFVSGILDSRFQ